MSNLKRKDAPGETPTAKVKKSKGGAEQSEKPAKAPVVSLLKDEEPLFPRGGANILTPLEQKQIQLEAKADVIREEQALASGKPSKKKNAASKTSGKKAEIKSSDDSIKVESLSFKVFYLLFLGKCWWTNVLTNFAEIGQGLARPR